MLPFNQLPLVPIVRRPRSQEGAAQRTCRAALRGPAGIGAVVGVPALLLPRPQPAANAGRQGGGRSSCGPSSDAGAGNPPPAEAAPVKAKHRKIPTTPIEIAEALGLPLLLAFLGTSVIAVWFTIETAGRRAARPRDSASLSSSGFCRTSNKGTSNRSRRCALCEENGSSIALDLRPRHPQVGQIERRGRTGDHRRR